MGCYMKNISLLLLEEVPDYGWIYKTSAFFLVVLCLIPWIILIFLYAFKRFRVRFYGIHGEVISDVKYKKNEEIVLPDDTFINGYVFDGWYEDPEFLTPLSYNYVKPENVKIYGKWDKVDCEEV